MKFLLLTLLSISIIDSYLSQTTDPVYYYQRIKYVDFFRSGYENYHLFKLSISTSALTEDLTEPYKLAIKRNTKDTNSIEKFPFIPVNTKYQQFFPDLNSIHPKFKKYVIWDLDKECPNSSLNSAGNLVFKLRYFDCDEELNLFYDSLVNTNKAKNLASKFIDLNVVLSTNTTFQNKSNLIKVLNGEETTLLSSVFCIR